jgi:hypothetical protein
LTEPSFTPVQIAELARSDKQIWQCLEEQAVVHNKYGHGIIRAVSRDADPTFTVEFDGAAGSLQKRLILASFFESVFTEALLDAKAAAWLEKIGNEQALRSAQALQPAPALQSTQPLPAPIEPKEGPPGDVPASGLQLLDTERFCRFAASYFNLWKMLEGSQVLDTMLGLGEVTRVERKAFPLVWVKFGASEQNYLSWRFPKDFKKILTTAEVMAAVNKFELEHQYSG